VGKELTALFQSLDVPRLVAAREDRTGCRQRGPKAVCDGMELDCLEILEALAVELPDCTLDGVNGKVF
jgi:hypothetical protein